jgi:hypothetical protein
MKTIHRIELAGLLIMRSFHKIFAISLVPLFVLTACQPDAPFVASFAPAWKAAKIELNPTGTPTLSGTPGNIIIISDNNGCKKGAGVRKGCVHFAQDEVGTLTFTLQGAPGPKSCGPGAPNVITRIRLTDTDASNGTSPSEKGDFTSSYPLPEEIRDEAFPELTIADGVVYEASSLEFGLNEITISNINGHDASLGTVNFWYEVTVSRCSDGAVWATDPRGENEGMN